jgi:hypothetical protein
MSDKRPDAPPGDYAALSAGARLIAQIDCGNYGEETLRAWKLPGGLIVLDWTETNRLVILPSDELVVSSKGFVASNGPVPDAFRAFAGMGWPERRGRHGVRARRGRRSRVQGHGPAHDHHRHPQLVTHARDFMTRVVPLLLPRMP